MAGMAEFVPARLRPREVGRVASVGLRTRPLRTAMSALGIAIGVAAMVGVLGISASSQAGLLAQIDRLGTNLLTVTPGQNLLAQTAKLPKTAFGMISRIGPVTRVSAVGALSLNVYRSDRVPPINTSGIAVSAARTDLLATLGGTVRRGRFLTATASSYPDVVLGDAAAARLGIDRLYAGQRVWLGGHWFYVIGILNPMPLAPELDSSVLIGIPVAEAMFGYDDSPTTIYVRAATDQVQAVDNVLGATANPEDPSQVQVSRPSDTLVARAAAKSAFTGLFLGLGALALFVGGVGVANIMVIAVLERRSEIGLRRALGATRSQIRTQFLAEAVLIALLGGMTGCLAGACATAIYASIKHWSILVPASSLAGGVVAATAIGVLAGLLPAIRAARLDPTDALRTV